MRFFVGLLIGFMAGTFYALYQTIEAPEGKLVSLMQGIKALMGVF
ncbi:hypothetical protein NSA56_01335 [Oceanobacillus caeni]|nr:hypothetical protein [Oceanobacillus caeni]MCR1833038.1 hypothetical protein [Oceanobacillus caeni]